MIIVQSVAANSLLHGACAVVYGILTTLIVSRSPLSKTGLCLAFACSVTSLWAAASALTWHLAFGPVTSWLELMPSAAWYGFILHLYRPAIGAKQRLTATLKTIGVLVIACILVIEWSFNPVVPDLQSISIAMKLGFAVCNLLLLENLYCNTAPDSRWNIKLLCVGLGGIFLYDLLLYADALLFHRLSFILVEARAPAFTFAAPLIALATVRNRRWAVDIHVSRDVVFHSLTLIGSGVFLLAIAISGEIFRSGGSEWGSVAETSMIFAGVLVVAVTVTSGTARSRIMSLVLNNFFSHRFDYHKEWMRCINALTAPDIFVTLDKRAVRAAADVVDSPAGALFVRPPRDVAFQWAGSWNTPAVTASISPGHPLVAAFRGSDWVVWTDEHAGAETWLPELPESWIVLPLNHSGTLIGFVVLARPRVHFVLDQEAFDLLRVIAREIASRLAEQRAIQALTQTQQLREYNQRYAFVIHDMKNVSGQLSMLLNNAERYVDNPEFQRDMLTTLRASVSKITRLLSRLKAEHPEHEQPSITPTERLRDLVNTRSLIGRRNIGFSDHSGVAEAAIAPDAFDMIVTHLLNNAVEASANDATIDVVVSLEAHNVVVDIIDHGPGMAPEFVRDELFRPLRTTKHDGHGIGAFQARELLRDAGGDLLVISKPTVGTTMRVILPSVRPNIAHPVPAEA